MQLVRVSCIKKQKAVPSACRMELMAGHCELALLTQQYMLKAPATCVHLLHFSLYFTRLSGMFLIHFMRFFRCLFEVINSRLSLVDLTSMYFLLSGTRCVFFCVYQVELWIQSRVHSSHSDKATGRGERWGRFAYSPTAILTVIM